MGLVIPELHGVQLDKGLQGEGPSRTLVDPSVGASTLVRVWGESVAFGLEVSDQEGFPTK